VKSTVRKILKRHAFFLELYAAAVYPH